METDCNRLGVVSLTLALLFGIAMAGAIGPCASAPVAANVGAGGEPAVAAAASVGEGEEADSAQCDCNGLQSESDERGYQATTSTSTAATATTTVAATTTTATHTTTTATSATTTTTTIPLDYQAGWVDLINLFIPDEVCARSETSLDSETKANSTRLAFQKPCAGMTWHTSWHLWHGGIPWMILAASCMQTAVCAHVCARVCTCVHQPHHKGMLTFVMMA